MRLNDQQALIVTTDFFTPVVDDPYQYGRIAAVNALSDIYAMGGQPFVALNLLAVPQDKLPNEIIEQILLGGMDAAREADCLILGGHSIDDPEPKYGLAVVGMVHPDKIVSNSGAKPGDVLILTKPLGTGLIATAIKADMAENEHIEAMIESAGLLNKSAMEVALEHGVHAMTDVTGFGLLGHLKEICEASSVGARIELESLPRLAGAMDCIEQGLIPGGTHANLKYTEPKLTREPGADPDLVILAADAQTSGGLLISIDEEKAKPMLAKLGKSGPYPGWIIGRILEDPQSKIIVS